MERLLETRIAALLWKLIERQFVLAQQSIWSRRLWTPGVEEGTSAGARMVVSSAYCTSRHSCDEGMSFTYKRNNVGPVLSLGVPLR